MEYTHVKAGLSSSPRVLPRYVRLNNHSLIVFRLRPLPGDTARQSHSLSFQCHELELPSLLLPAIAGDFGMDIRSTRCDLNSCEQDSG
jgi:hypothetical protein